MIRERFAAGLTRDDSVAAVIEGLLGEFENQLASHVIFRVILSCRAELTSCPDSVLPERMRRLAQLRLTAATLAA